MERFPSSGEDAELSDAENKYIRHAWRTTGDSTLGVLVQQPVIME